MYLPSGEMETKFELPESASNDSITDEIWTTDYVYVLDNNGICGELGVRSCEKTDGADCSGVKVEMEIDGGRELLNECMNDTDGNTGSNKRKRKPTLDLNVKNAVHTKTVHENEKNVQLPLVSKDDTSLCDTQARTNHKTMTEETNMNVTVTNLDQSRSDSSTNINALRKNRRKKSIPVRYIKADIDESVEEYADVVLSSAVGNDRLVKSDSVLDISSGQDPEDLSLAVTNDSVNDNKPIDISIPATNQTSIINVNADMVKGIAPVNLMPSDPVQMKQFVDNVVKLQTQFPDQMLPATQIMHFQSMHLLLNMMAINNGIVPNITESRCNSNALKLGISANVNENLLQESRKVNFENLCKNGELQNQIIAAVDSLPIANYGGGPVVKINQAAPKQVKKQREYIPKSNFNRTSVSKMEGIPLKNGQSKTCNHFVIENLKNFFPVNTNGEITLDDNENLKFFVKDNEQIQAIVNSLLQVGLLEEKVVSDHESARDLKYICRACNHTFFHAEHLTKHVKKHHILKRFVCQQCDRSFHDAGNYRQHMRVHDESDIPFECPECKRKFRHKCTLKVHLRIHTGEKPFRCDICGTKFKISSGLQTHMRKHTGETPYACEFCNLRFKCQSNLKQHLFQHTQARPFACDVCGKSYSRKSIRDQHMSTHAKPWSGDIVPLEIR